MWIALQGRIVMHHDVIIALQGPGLHGVVPIVQGPMQFWDQTRTSFGAGRSQAAEADAPNMSQRGFAPIGFGAPEAWGLSHRLRWCVSPLVSGSRQTDARRHAYSAGQCAEFTTTIGPITNAPFSELVRVFPDGSVRLPEIRISLEESDD
ncbi:MAG: hypothetical protein AAGH74_03015 [Pseudomonadota bacterium]